jgi:hypothetical protein
MLPSVRTNALRTFDVKKMDYDDVEQHYNDIISALKKAATETLPTVSFKKHLKPLPSVRTNALRTFDVNSLEITI